jgi:hypothetical protein
LWAHVPAIDVPNEGEAEHYVNSSVFKAHVLEIVISVAAIGLGLLMWSAMNASSLNLPVGAGLLVGGAIIIVLTIKSILRYMRIDRHRRRETL